MKINCPKCGKETEISINKAIDADGEVFMCNHCNYPFRYVIDHVKKYKKV